MPNTKPPKELYPEELIAYFRQQGSIGGKIGGKIGGPKAAANMTAEQRRARALKASAAATVVRQQKAAAKRAALAKASQTGPRKRPKV